jgi:shikimate dehydrogenase
MASPITLCGSLSRLASPLGRSMHEAGYRELGLAFTYVPFEVRELKDAIAGMRGLNIRGFGVSQPFKEDVIPLLDAIDPIAARIGAVNTIVNDGGRLVGHNTDWIGATRALEVARGAIGSPLDGQRALLLGGGGAARAIAFGLREKNARVTVANRSADKAARLARESGAETLPWSERTRSARDFDVVINATTMGQADADPESPLPAEALRAGQIVMDIVYKPTNTRLLEAARRAGATPVHGGQMLLHQACAQFELYTGKAAPLEAMRGALRRSVPD